MRHAYRQKSRFFALNNMLSICFACRSTFANRFNLSGDSKTKIKLKRIRFDTDSMNGRQIQQLEVFVNSGGTVFINNL